MQVLARQLLDLGADLYRGHSNHTLQRVFYSQGKAILYSSGDFIDDYAVDPADRNDLSFLFMLEVQDGHLERLRLYPIRMENCRVGNATDHDALHLERHMPSKYRAFCTALTFEDYVGVIPLG